MEEGIYGLGNPADTYKLLVGLEKGQTLDRQDFLRALLEAIEAEFEGNKGSENAEAARMTHAHTTTD